MKYICKTCGKVFVLNRNCNIKCPKCGSRKCISKEGYNKLNKKGIVI
jgi:DNA-directed RNA polymerase subunit RPC12/RpoP